MVRIGWKTLYLRPLLSCRHPPTKRRSRCRWLRNQVEVLAVRGQVILAGCGLPSTRSLVSEGRLVAIRAGLGLLLQSCDVSDPSDLLLLSDPGLISAGWLVPKVWSLSLSSFRFGRSAAYF